MIPKRGKTGENVLLKGKEQNTSNNKETTNNSELRRMGNKKYLRRSHRLHILLPEH